VFRYFICTNAFASKRQQVKGVGTLIALTYVLTLDDPHRFRPTVGMPDVFWGCVLGAEILVGVSPRCTSARKVTPI
jgi:hypothetical protein